MNQALEKEISDIEKKIDLLNEKEKKYEEEIIKLENKINDREQVIRNMNSKLEENNEKIDVLEKKVRYAEEKYEYLESKIEKLEKNCENSSVNFPCNLCDIIFKTECKLDEHTADMHTNKEGNNESISEAASNIETSDKDTSNLAKPDEKVFQCDECTYKSSSENGIKIHKTKKHVHVCQFCYQKFKNSVDKSNHVSGCSSYYDPPSPIMSPIRGRFPLRFPPRFPYRLPHSPMW